MRSTLRHSFSKLGFDFNTSKSLLQIHKDSHSNFLLSKIHGEPSIKEVFMSNFPINDSYGYVSMEYVDYRVVSPKLSAQECRDKDLTYESEIFATFRLVLFSIDETTGVRSVKIIKDQELYVCSIPLITDNASFVVNGIDRIVICQIHKSPGVFFSRKAKDNKVVIYSATIIPYRGSRLQFSFDSKSVVNFRVDKRKKLSSYYLLRALEFSNEEIIKNFYYPLELKREKSGLYSFKFDIEYLIGIAPSFNFRDKDGNIIFVKDDIILRSIVRKFKDLKEFFCEVKDLEGRVLYRKVENDLILKDVPIVLNKSVIKHIESEKIDFLCIIDENRKDFNPVMIESILVNPEITYENALFTIHKILRPGEPFVLKDSKMHFNNIFFSDTYYSLFAVGRYKMNSTLDLKVDESCLVLTKDDIVATIKKTIELKQLNLPTQDIDHLSNRRVRSVGELVESQFRIGIGKVAKFAFEKLNSLILDTAVPSDFITSSPIQKSIKEFFMLSELSQFMEQTNLLSEISHARKISSLGNGGISRNRASAEVRDIHPTHYGRICPIETPDGQNIGLITSLASYAIINRYGFIETPYRKVVDGKITNEIQYLDSLSEGNYHIGQIARGAVLNDRIIDEIVPARYQGDFTMSNKDEITYVDVGLRQIVSVASSLVPFLESNDTARALMGCNMQRQAVPLLKTQAPYVGTGIESYITKDSIALIIAKRNGVVSAIDSDMIMVDASDSQDGDDNIVDIYHLKKFKRSNQSTCFNQKVLVKTGEKISKGQVLADGPATANGELALGKNVLVAFMPWNGYNYEDSVVISERLLVKDDFTSVHIEEFEVVARDTRLGPEEITKDICGVNEVDLRYLDESGVIHIGVNVKAGDILIGKVTPKSETPMTSEEKLLRAIFGDKASEVKDSSLRVPPGIYGTIIDVKILTRRGNLKDHSAMKIEREQLIKRDKQKEHEVNILRAIFDKKLNDLLLGSKISVKGKKSEEVINLEFLNSLKLSEKFNLNVDNQEIMKSIGLLIREYDAIMSKIENEYIIDVQKIMDGDDLPNGVLKVIKVYVATKSRLQPGDKIAGRHGNKGVISVAVPVEDMPFMEDGTPIDLILSSISVPGRMNIGQVLETHLGLISYGVGRKIDEMIEKKSAISKIRSFLESVSTDDSFSEELAKMNDEEIIALAESYKNGMYFSTPVFDSAKADDMGDLCEKVGFDRSGQVYLYDGKSGERFDRPVTVGYMYVLKLHHLVDGKIHARSTGPYSLVTQQPLGGKSHFGGQRVGEMECWALQAYGAAYTLQEMLTVKSDDVSGRRCIYEAIINGETRFYSGIPESFNVLCKELSSLGFDLEFGNNS